MENVLFTSDPIMILMLTIIVIALITLGRKLELPLLPAIIVVAGLGLLVYHTVALNRATEAVVSPYYFSIAVDLVFLFLGFVTYLWIDDIVAKDKKLKSYGDPMSWFWDKL